MATVARPVVCKFKAQKPAVQSSDPAVPVQRPRLPPSATQTASESGKIVLQPRVCTLRSYGSDLDGVIKFKGRMNEVSPFFATLSEYIESSKTSQDFETISGRLAMVVFASTVAMEVATGNSLFQKTDSQGIAEAAGVCLLAVACAATFAWFSSARNRVGRVFTVGCNTFIDSLIDQIVDGLFYDSELSDWSDEM